MIQVVDENSHSQRLDVFLSKALGQNRAFVQKDIEQKNVLVNGTCQKSSYRLRTGDEVEILKSVKEPKTVEPQDIPLDILFEDEHLLVVNKPKNMLTHPTSFESKGTLVNALLHHCHESLSNAKEPLRRGIVHRLDKNTSGLLVVAKTDEAHECLAEQIKQKTATRRYLAVVLGEVKEDEGVIDKPLMHSLKQTVKMVIDETSPLAKPARTRYKVLERFLGATFLELELETGRTHQIRAHMASLSHPVFGDELYGSKGFRQFSKIKTQGQVLQSTFLRFTHPKNFDIMEFELQKEHWDKDLVKVLGFFRK